METMVHWLRDEKAKIPQHVLRFMAHLVLFLMGTQRGLRVRIMSSSSVLDGYTKRSKGSYVIQFCS